MDIQQQSMMNQTNKETNIFVCNLCVKNPKEPVLTSCGHVFCWICLFKAAQGTQKCPTCQQSITIEKSYPIFVENIDEPLQSLQEAEIQQQIIQRPKPIFTDRIPNPGMGGNTAQSLANLSSNLSHGKKISGMGYSSCGFIQTFNSIQSPAVEDIDHKLYSFCGVFTKILVASLIICVTVVLFI